MWAPMGSLALSRNTKGPCKDAGTATVEGTRAVRPPQPPVPRGAPLGSNHPGGTVPGSSRGSHKHQSTHTSNAPGLHVNQARPHQPRSHATPSTSVQGHPISVGNTPAADSTHQVGTTSGPSGPFEAGSSKGHHRQKGPIGGKPSSSRIWVAKPTPVAPTITSAQVDSAQPPEVTSETNLSRQSTPLSEVRPPSTTIPSSGALPTPIAAASLALVSVLEDSQLGISRKCLRTNPVLPTFNLNFCSESQQDSPRPLKRTFRPTKPSALGTYCSGPPFVPDSQSLTQGPFQPLLLQSTPNEHRMLPIPWDLVPANSPAHNAEIGHPLVQCTWDGLTPSEDRRSPIADEPAGSP